MQMLAMRVVMHITATTATPASTPSKLAEMQRQDRYISFQSQNVYIHSETSSLHCKPKLRNAWGQEKCVSTLWRCCSSFQYVNATPAACKCCPMHSSAQGPCQQPLLLLDPILHVIKSCHAQAEEEGRMMQTLFMPCPGYMLEVSSVCSMLRTCAAAKSDVYRYSCQNKLADHNQLRNQAACCHCSCMVLHA